MREFAEEEIRIPDGPYEGLRFDCSVQPYTRLLYDAIDSGKWSRFVVTGPSQTGKTLSAFCIPIFYHLFEMEESVVCGLPDMEMAGDKWRVDLLPAIESSRYRELLPSSGGGSRGAKKVESIQFRNGRVLKFMSGGGGDKSRAGFSSRVLVITETDGMDKTGKASREADKITQMEARLRAYGDRSLTYMECTVSIEEGRTWKEYKGGTESRIAMPCVGCGEYVTPGRGNLVGWQDAESVQEAKEESAYGCPSCGALWSEEERAGMCARAVLVHKGQTVRKDGTLEGSPPVTDTLGFRWSAPDNLFLTAGAVGVDEWRAKREPDEELAEKKLSQFVWALPYSDPDVDLTALQPRAVARRVTDLPRGVAPAGTQCITMAADLGKWRAHWVAVAWLEGASSQVLDYGVLDVASDSLGVEKALTVALRELADMAKAGWPIATPDGERLEAMEFWADAGWQTPTIYEWARASVAEGYPNHRAVLGEGASQHQSQRYNRPKTTGAVVRHVGQWYHVALDKRQQLMVIHCDADQWKTWTHERLSVPVGAAGSMAFFAATSQEHNTFSRHLCAERPVEEYEAGKGTRIRWIRLSRENHWLDTVYNASAAAHFCGVRLLGEQPAAPVQKKKKKQKPTSLRGRSFVSRR